MSIDEFLKEAREKAKLRRLAETWKPEKEGEELYGVVEDVFPNPWDSTVMTCIVRTPDGRRYMLPRNKVLVSALTEDMPNVGDMVYVRYEGEGKKKGGFKAPKLFAVYVKHAAAPVETPAEARAEEAEMPKVETAREVEAVEEPAEKDAEKVREALSRIAKKYGVYLTNLAFEKALKSEGIEMTADEVKSLLPEAIKTAKRGVMIRL
ncbi:MAG: hypothetical protein QXV23_06480 [Candidatus Bathyarchaeia archaeon]